MSVGIPQEDLDARTSEAAARLSDLEALLAGAEIPLPEINISGILKRTEKAERKATRKLDKRLRKIDRKIMRPLKLLRQGITKAKRDEALRRANAFGVKETLLAGPAAIRAGQVPTPAPNRGPVVTKPAARAAAAQVSGAEAFAESGGRPVVTPGAAAGAAALIRKQELDAEALIS